MCVFIQLLLTFFPLVRSFMLGKRSNLQKNVAFSSLNLLISLNISDL